jgi:hypothetical protein
MARKVLFSLPDSSSFYLGVYRAFSYLGYEVINYDFRKFSLKEKYLLVVAKDQKQAIFNLNLRLQNYLKEKNPRLFFVMKCETIQKETLELAKKMGIFTVNWFPDYVNAFELALKLSSYYDYFSH